MHGCLILDPEKVICVVVVVVVMMVTTVTMIWKYGMAIKSDCHLTFTVIPVSSSNAAAFDASTRAVSDRSAAASASSQRFDKADTRDSHSLGVERERERAVIYRDFRE